MMRMLTDEERNYLLCLKNEGFYGKSKKTGKGYIRSEILWQIHYLYMKYKNGLDMPHKVHDFRDHDRYCHKKNKYSDKVLEYPGEIEYACRYGLSKGFLEIVHENCRGRDYKFTSLVRR